MNGIFKNLRCLAVDPSNAAKISDIGTALAYISAENNMLNLAILYMNSGG
jgi:hypothetical protein